MVLISPPDDWNPHVADEDCDTVDEIEPPEWGPLAGRAERPSILPQPPPLVRPPTVRSAMELDDGQDPFEQPPPMPAASAGSGEPDESERPSESDMPGSAVSPLLPDDEWVSPAVQDRRQWLMVGAAAVLGVVLSVILVGFWASRHADVTREPPGTMVTERPLLVTDDAAASRQQPVPGDSEADEPGESGPGADPEAARSTDSDDEDDEAPDSERGKSAETGRPPQPPADRATAAEEDQPQDPLPADVPSRKKATEPVEAVASEDAGKPADDRPDASALTRSLQAFAPFIRDDPYRAADSAGSEQDDTELPDIEPWEDSPGEQVSIPRPEPREVNVAERLQDTVAGLDIPGMPLVSFTHFVTGLSTIPISLDPDALALLRIKPDRPVAVKVTDEDVGGILDAALGPLGLGYVAVNGQLLVTRARPADGQLRRVRHPVGDLVGDSAERLDQLADWIIAMIEPDSWDAQGGPGVLQAELPDLLIRHQDTVLMRVLLFCERLRAARGLPPTTQLDPELIRLELLFRQADSLLAKPVRIPYDEPVLMLRILQRITRETGMQILIDWQSLGQMGWSPAAETVLSADGMALSEALTEMLRPMDLTYRVIDATTVQITSSDADRARWDVVEQVGDPERKGTLSFAVRPPYQRGDAEQIMRGYAKTGVVGAVEAYFAAVVDGTIDPELERKVVALKEGFPSLPATTCAVRNSFPVSSPSQTSSVQGSRYWRVTIALAWGLSITCSFSPSQRIVVPVR
jgi:hypothetical protein